MTKGAPRRLPNNTGDPAWLFDRRPKLPSKRTTGNTEAQAPDSYGNKEEFERDLIHRILEITESWRTCRVAKCRRLRRCAGARFFCVKKAKPMTPEEVSQMQAELRHGLNQRLAELRRKA